MKKIYIMLSLFLAIFLLTACQKDDKNDTTSYEGNISYKVAVDGFEFGAAVTKVVLDFETNKTFGTFDQSTFTAKANTKTRTIKDAYVSDAFGVKSNSQVGQYLTLEFSVVYEASAFGGSVSENDGAFTYDFQSQMNEWASLDIYSIVLGEDQSITIDDVIYHLLDVDKDAFSGVLSLNTDQLVKDTYEKNGITLTYAAYENEDMKNDQGQNALIIWLHGMGEGGTDIDIALLGNDVTELMKDDIQSYFKSTTSEGAYVLAVQTPSFWMESTDGQMQTGEKDSRYTEILMETIKTYVNSNADIDLDRIYIGGCSNGGYMTMNMLFNYTSYFAAAYPVCEAYEDRYITQDMIDLIKDMPMWFVASNDDTTVAVADFTIPTYVRLIQSGGQNIHLSLFENVESIDYEGVSYMGHWSWVYVFNNQVSKDQNAQSVLTDGIDAVNAPSNQLVEINGQEVNLWGWLAEQSK